VRDGGGKAAGSGDWLDPALQVATADNPRRKPRLQDQYTAKTAFSVLSARVSWPFGVSATALGLLSRAGKGPGLTPI
jgi:hypothetical protein